MNCAPGDPGARRNLGDDARGEDMVTGWTVVLRGIRHRAGRSLAVLLLATIATAATVLAPGYARAASESVLRDGLAGAPVDATSLEVWSQGTATAAPSVESTDEAKVVLSQATQRRGDIETHFDRPIAGVHIDAVAGAITTGGRDTVLLARVAYRDSACRHVSITDGECPQQQGQVMISKRTADEYRLKVGTILTLRAKESSGTPTSSGRDVEVVGLYEPEDAAEPYWGRGGYFTSGTTDPDAALIRTDSIFVADEQDLAVSGAAATVHLTYQLRPATVGLDDVGPLRADLGAFGLDVAAAQMELATTLPAVLEDVDRETAALGRTVPVVAVPLVLLCWFVLFLLVGTLTEERAPEVALAKLRGYPLGRAARFGRAETLLLIVLAVPIGAVVGTALVELAARTLLADGVHAEARLPVLLAAAGALVAGLAAALLAGRRVLARPVLALLRRVPERGRWQAGLAEGAVVALAGASLAAAAGDRSSPLALLAPAMLAVVAGIVAGRLLRLWAAGRMRVGAWKAGRLPGLLASAQIARRPLAQRVMVVVTIAIALLSFAATAWDVAAQARSERAQDAVGANRVLRVAVDSPAALVDALGKADPDGRSMAVVRASQLYLDGYVELVGVDSARLADVAVWRGHDRAAVERVAGLLRPTTAAPLPVEGFIEVAANTVGLEGTGRLLATVAGPGVPARTVSLGDLAGGSRRYRGSLDACPTDCRLIGLAISPTTAGGGPLRAEVRVTSLSTKDGRLDAGFDEDGRWRASQRGSATGAKVTPGSALRVSVDTGDSADIAMTYVDTPDTLPVALAGPSPSDDATAERFSFPAFAEQPQQFGVVAREASLPRVGERGLLFDLDYAVRLADRTSSLADNSRLRYEVWAAAGAPADLGRRLADLGVQTLGDESIASHLSQLGRQAPALGLRLYLMAGSAALALAVGAVLLTSYIGAATRRYEFAALRVAGVRTRTLRRSVRREYLTILGVPLVLGLAAGIAGAVIMLPGIPLVTTGAPVGDISFDIGPGALAVAVVCTVVGLVAAVSLVVGMVRRSTPDRLRDGI
jgi:hypothetical protein